MKRMSSEEKQLKLLSSLSFNTFYHIKEIEKICAKHFRSSAKEIVDILVSDNKIKQEKIGISNIFWKKPLNYKIELKKIHKKLEEKIHRKVALKSKKEEKEKLLQNKENQRLCNEIDLLKRELKETEDKINSTVTKKDYDFVIRKKEGDRREINKLTDNIFEVISYLKTKGKDSKEIYKAFGLNEDFDYI